VIHGDMLPSTEVDKFTSPSPGVAAETDGDPSRRRQYIASVRMLL